MTAPTPDQPTESTQPVRLRNIAVAMSTQGRASWATDVLIAADALAAVTAERDQARQMLADAPHADTFCTAGEPYGQSECICWKSAL